MNSQEIDFVKLITDTINSLCNNLFSSIDNSIYPILDNITFITADNFVSSAMEKIIGTTPASGILVLANALLARFYSILRYSTYIFSLPRYTNTTT